MMTRRPRRGKLRLWILLVLTVPLGFLTFVLFLASPAGERSGQGVSPEEANSRVHQRIDIPRTARDVNYRSNVWLTFADFAIDESDLLEWCREYKMEPFPLNDDNQVSFRFADGRDEEFLIIDDGFSFGTSDRCGQHGVFDRRAGRASVSFFCK
jgi:hypothetical protein